MGKKALIISVNMGYGHQRTAYSLKNFAFKGKIILANDYKGIPLKDREIWEVSRESYEFVSRFKRVPLIGNAAFLIFDAFQRILSFYPRRDLSKPTFVLKRIYSLIRRGWGADLIRRVSHEGLVGKMALPLISTFFTPAFMAEFFNYPGEIFCVVCDTDISRTWAPLKPRKSRIKYFAPTHRVVERLISYGIKKENIFLTGYPLPLENADEENLEMLKENLKNRIVNLDPRKSYFKEYKFLIEKKLGKLPHRYNHPLTIMFSVGGAGAQKEIGVKILKSLLSEIREEKIRVILSVGIREKVEKYFLRNIKELDLGNKLSKSIEIIFEKNIEDYFREFNKALMEADVLWTKPSELSFYSALGLPIIIAPPVGSQERFNRDWLLKSGFGLTQKNPIYTKQWLSDWLDRGYLAEAAMEGFIEGERLGTSNIKRIISKCPG